jgi:hypothetical protein
MPRVGFESTIPVFERAKTVYALDRAATVIGYELLKGLFRTRKEVVLQTWANILA